MPAGLAFYGLQTRKSLFFQIEKQVKLLLDFQFSLVFIDFLRLCRRPLRLRPYQRETLVVSAKKFSWTGTLRGTKVGKKYGAIKNEHGKLGH